MRTLIHSCGNCDTLCKERSWKNLLVGCGEWSRTVQEIEVPDELIPILAFEMEYQSALADLRNDLLDK